MNKLVSSLKWVAAVIVILVLVALGLRVARALIGVAVVVGLAVMLYALFGGGKKGKGKGTPKGS